MGNVDLFKFQMIWRFRVDRLFHLHFKPFDYYFRNKLSPQGDLNPTLSFGGQIDEKFSIENVPVDHVTMNFMLRQNMHQSTFGESKYTFVNQTCVGREIGRIEFYSGPYLHIHIGLMDEQFAEVIKLAANMAAIDVGFIGKISVVPKKTDSITEPYEFLWGGSELKILSLAYSTRVIVITTRQAV